MADVAVLLHAAGSAECVLLDVRRAAFTPSAIEAEELIAALAGFAAVAIVADPDASFGCARMLSTLVELRGSNASAFFTTVEAESWLMAQLGRVASGPVAARKRPRT